jgi:hypothetical protein
MKSEPMGIERVGLPALCIAFARRNFACGVLAIVASPFAVGFENLRESFDVS